MPVLQPIMIVLTSSSSDTAIISPASPTMKGLSNFRRPALIVIMNTIYVA